VSLHVLTFRSAHDRAYTELPPEMSRFTLGKTPTRPQSTTWTKVDEASNPSNCAQEEGSGSERAMRLTWARPAGASGLGAAMNKRAERREQANWAVWRAWSAASGVGRCCEQAGHGLPPNKQTWSATEKKTDLEREEADLNATGLEPPRKRTGLAKSGLGRREQAGLGAAADGAPRSGLDRAAD
jgi:hypothetical protein